MKSRERFKKLFILESLIDHQYHMLFSLPRSSNMALSCRRSLILFMRILAGICFRTDLDRQEIMPYTSPIRVKEHVFEVFEALGTSDGGIVACGEISENVPLETIRAMYEGFMEYKY